eukprot:SAG11_NODE_157_length_14147_cov_8.545202_12_plen_62_part_00
MRFGLCRHRLCPHRLCRHRLCPHRLCQGLLAVVRNLSQTWMAQCISFAPNPVRIANTDHCS